MHIYVFLNTLLRIFKLYSIINNVYIICPFTLVTAENVNFSVRREEDCVVEYAKRISINILKVVVSLILGCNWFGFIQPGYLGVIGDLVQITPMAIATIDQIKSFTKRCSVYTREGRGDLLPQSYIIAVHRRHIGEKIKKTSSSEKTNIDLARNKTPDVWKKWTCFRGKQL